MTLSGQHLGIADIVSHYTDCRSALRSYFSKPAEDPERFATLSKGEISQDLITRLEELELTQSLVVLAAIEAMFRVDFEKRCSGRKRLPLVSEFRQLRRTKSRRISFDEDILELWKAHGLLASTLVGDIRSAMNLRHWLAHGRYWTAKLGRRYDFDSLVDLMDALARSNVLLS